MTTIKIKKADCLCNDEEVTDFLDVLQGIAYACDAGKYSEGYRNEIAVNLTVSAHMLGLEPKDVLDAFMDEEIIMEADDDEYPHDRVETVLGYHRRFDWTYMLDPMAYKAYAIAMRGNPCPVTFVLED